MGVGGSKRSRPESYKLKAVEYLRSLRQSDTYLLHVCVCYDPSLDPRIRSSHLTWITSALFKGMFSGHTQAKYMRKCILVMMEMWSLVSLG